MKSILISLIISLIPISGFSKEIYWSDVPFESGQTIHEARSALIKNGWKPVNNYIDGPPEWDPMGFYKAGVVEVVDCAGTGAGNCIFFYKKGERCLTIYTSGEENPEEGYYARIDSFNFSCSQRYLPENEPVVLIKGIVDSSDLIRHVKLKQQADWTKTISVFSSENKKIKSLAVKFSYQTAISDLKIINEGKEQRFVFFKANDNKWEVLYYWDIEKDVLYYRLINLKTGSLKFSKNLQKSNSKTEFIKSDLKQY